MKSLDAQEFGHKLDFMSFNLTLEWSLLDFVWLGNHGEKVDGLLPVVAVLVFSFVFVIQLSRVN